MSKKFDNWNEVKKTTETIGNVPQFKAREIYHAKIGENIGFEQSGKGDEFLRPVLILKRLTKEIFFGIPLSTTPRVGSFFYNFEFLAGVESSALLVQTKLFSSKRLLNKIGMIKKEDFENLRKKLNDLMFDGDFTPPSESAGRPEGNCENIISKNEINSNPTQTFEEIKQLGSYTYKATAMFTLTQTEEKLTRDNIQGKTKANQTHYEVGKKVRETIAELGGTMPEELPTPKESVSKIEKSHKSLEGKNHE